MVTGLLMLVLALFALPHACAGDIASGLAGWYQFNGNADDASGSGMHGIVYNAVPVTDRLAAPTSAYYFNGTDAYITLPTSFLSSRLLQGSITAWIRLDDRSPVAGGAIVNKGDTDLQVFVTPDRKLGLALDSRNAATSDASLPIGVWCFVAVVWNNGAVTYYVDAAFAGGSLVDRPTNPWTEQVTIGKVKTTFFRGEIDELRFYVHALNEEDIRTGYLSTLPAPPVITLEPNASTVLLVGSTLTLSVQGYSLLQSSVQWLHAGNVLTAATEPLLRFTNIQSLHAGDYRAILMNSMGTVTSQVATVTVLLPDGDEDNDGVPNRYEVEFGTKWNTPDSDDDGLTDAQELFIYHSDPRNPDTNEDGTSDGAAVLAGLDPTARGTVYYYDRTDRLVGAEYRNGFGLVYQYDGNGNLTRQVGLKRATNGLSAVWAQLNGLTSAGPSGGLFGDADNDGWSNYQEWKAGSNPTSIGSVPDVFGPEGDVLSTMAWPFVPSNFVIGVGQLDGVGAEEVVIGADGDPGANTSFLVLLTQTSTEWTVRRIDIGAVGVTSVSVGQVTNRTSPAIYLGFRSRSGSGGVMEVRQGEDGRWVADTIARSTNEVAQLVGVEASGSIVAEMATTNSPPNSLVAVHHADGVWTTQLRSPVSGGRSLGILTGEPGTSSRGVVRLLDRGGIEIAHTMQAGNGLIGYWNFDDGDFRDTSGENLTGTPRGSPTAVLGLSGGGMAFNGTSDYIVVPYTPAMNVSTGLTMSVWIKPESWTSFNEAVHVFGRTREDNTDVYRLVKNNSWLGFALGYGLGQPMTVSMGVPPLNEWHHIAGTWDGSAMQLYLDGGLISSQEVVGSIGDGATDDLYIGKKSNLDEYYHGAMDEIRLYNRALSADEVRDLSKQAGATAWVPRVIDEPSLARVHNWRGGTFASGSVRTAAANSLFYAFVEDKDTDGQVGVMDELVLAEYEMAGSLVAATNVTRLRVVGPPVAPSYALACARYLDTTNEVVFTGEPDGRVFAWTATNWAGPLDRRLFSARFAGRAWHAMTAIKTLESGEGLIGLMADPAMSNACNVVYWPPRRELWQPSTVPQTPPIASLSGTPTSGEAVATNMVQIWDLEGSPSILELEWSGDGGGWSSVPILAVDGRDNGYVSAMPTGSVHTVVWKASGVFGVGVSTNIQMRVRARDVSAAGDWSTPLHYQVSIPTGTPTANDDVVLTYQDLPVDVEVLANDTVNPPFTLSLSGFTPGPHGQVSPTLDARSVRYEPSPGFVGEDVFEYTVSDGAGSNSTARVRVTVLPDTPPSVALTSPAEGVRFTFGDRVPLEATASDAERPLLWVRFYANDTMLTEMTTQPYRFTWVSVPSGSHSVWAQATDGVRTADSAKVRITVDDPRITLVALPIALDGRFGLSIRGAPGLEYEIEVTETLVSAPWKPIARVRSQGLIVEWRDDSVPASVARYYRVRLAQ